MNCYVLVKAFTMPMAASDKQKPAGEEGELGDELAARALQAPMRQAGR